MIGAPSAEEEDERLAVKFRREMLPEAPLELVGQQEAVLVAVEVLDRAPDQLLSMLVHGHDGRHVDFIHLLQAG